MISLTTVLLRQRPLPDPDAYAAKGDRGQLLVMAGAPSVPGAALLAAQAAFRAGAGKITLAVPDMLSLPLGLAVPEARVMGFADGTERSFMDMRESWDAILIGPGMDRAPARRAALALTEADWSATLVLDAAAIEHLATARDGHDGDIVITPHAGEMAKLTGASRESIEADPHAAARATAARFHAVVVLKNRTTVIASPEGDVFQHEANIPGLAISGSGDVLAGILAGLLARGTPTLDACLWAVVLHAQAGLAAAADSGPIGYLPHELPPLIPKLMATLS